MSSEPLDFEQPLNTNDYFPKPSFMLRIKSMFFDSLVIILLMFLASMLLNGLSVESGMVKGSVFVLIFLYEPLMVSVDRTLGQRMMGIRVVRKADVVSKEKQARRISFPASLVRYVMKGLLGWISLLTIHSDTFGQAIHDKVAGSVVCNA